MTYEEAEELLTQVRWKVVPCFAGESCWCRMIVPEEPIFYGENEEEIYIAPSGTLTGDIAKYIVELHNRHLNKDL